MSHGIARHKRVSDLLKKEVASMLLYDVKDPRIGDMVTIMGVEVTGDLRHATFFMSVMGDKAQKESALAGMRQARGFIRRTLGRRLDLKRIPELHFQLDTTLEEQERIEKLLAGIRHEEKH